jgi:hypothetical protein
MEARDLHDSFEACASDGRLGDVEEIVVVEESR